MMDKSKTTHNTVTSQPHRIIAAILLLNEALVLLIAVALFHVYLPGTNETLWLFA
jgi:hypothetical protein